MVGIQVGRALALLLTLVLGMFARPAQGGVAHAHDHALEAAEPGDDVANHERRPTVVQRFERPRTASEADSGCDDAHALVQSSGAGEAAALVRDVGALHLADLDPRSAWRSHARSRGPPATHR